MDGVYNLSNGLLIYNGTSIYKLMILDLQRYPHIFIGHHLKTAGIPSTPRSYLDEILGFPLAAANQLHHGTE